MKEIRKKKDVFIDKDGDGICDTRQGGMSFNKMRKRSGSGKMVLMAKVEVVKAMAMAVEIKNLNIKS